MMHYRIILSIFALSLPAGCALEMEEIDSGTFALGCPVSDCGGNAAAGNGYSIGELHTFTGENTGKVNTSNVKMLAFITPDGDFDFTLRTVGGRLRAVRGANVIEGHDLIGSKFRIGDNNGAVLLVTIHNVMTKPDWTAPASMVEHYVFSYLDDDTGQQLPVCADATSLSDEGAWAAVVSRERYSWDTVTVTHTGQTGIGWYNLVCNDNALFKMKMAGYERGGTRSTTMAQREATLKMLVADYCGTGESFTETGTPLAWMNFEGWSHNSYYADTEIEALWDKTGALCLDTPRLGVSMRQEILDACAAVGRTLPSCDGFSGAYEWRTLTPITSN